MASGRLILQPLGLGVTQKEMFIAGAACKIIGHEVGFGDVEKVFFGPDIVQRWLDERFEAFFLVKFGFLTRVSIPYFG